MRPPRTHDYRRSALGSGREIRRFEALAPGRFEAEGVGQDLQPGDTLRLTLKGSETLELVLSVREVRYKAIPTHGWHAVLDGEGFESLEIHRWSIVCDGCGRRTDFEFAAGPGAGPEARVAAAEARVATLGWSSHAERHWCPECIDGSAI